MNQFSIGPYHDETLANGLRVIVQEQHAAPVVSLHFCIGTGSIHETNAGHGLSHFLEHMVFKGSAKFPAKNEISDRVQGCGGYINAYTTKDHTSYYIDAGKEHTTEMLELLVDAVTAPLFPEEEFTLEKDVILNEEAMYRDNAGWNLQQQAMTQAANGHPFGYPVIGFPDKIAEVNREMMVDYYQRRYRPHLGTIVVVGDVHTPEIMAQIRQLTETWPRGLMETLQVPGLIPNVAKLETDMYFEDPHARLMMTWGLPTGIEEDVPALDVLETVLAGTNSSLFAETLKKREQLVFSASAMNYTLTEGGVFAISTSAEAEKIPAVQQRLFELLDVVRGGELDEATVKRAVTRSKISFVKQLQTVSNRAQLLVNAVVGYTSPSYWESYLRRLEEVTVADLQRVCKQYLSEDTVVINRQWPMELKATHEQQLVAEAEKEQPRCDLSVLPNSGVRFITTQIPEAVMSDCSIVFGGGAMYEDFKAIGVTTLMSRMMLGGAGPYDEDSLHRLMDDCGIQIGFSAGNNLFRCDVNCLPEMYEQALELVQLIFTENHFSEAIFKREKRNLIELLRSRDKKLFTPALRLVCEELYGLNHPYGHLSQGTVETIEKLTLDDVKTAFFNMLRRSETVVSTGGRIPVTGVAACWDALMSQLAWTDQSVPVFAEPDFAGGARHFDLDQPREQALGLLVIPACKAIDPERYAVEVLVATLNGQSSRLFKRIREDEGLAYDTGMTIRIGHHAGYLAFYAVTSPQKVDFALKLLREQLGVLAETGLTRQEFDESILQICSDRAFEQQESRSFVLNAAMNEYYGQGHDLFLNELDRFRNLDFEQCNEQLKAYLAHPRQISVVAGRMNLIEEARQAEHG